MIYKIITMVFAAVFFSTLVLYGILKSRMGNQNRNVKRRLDDLAWSPAEEEQATYSILRSDKLSEIPALNEMLRDFKFTERLQTLIIQSGVSINLGTLILAMLSLGGLSTLLAFQFLSNILVALGTGVFMGALPLLYLRYRKKKRRDAFETLLPDALDLVANALKSGFSFETAMKMVGQEVPDPLGVEFALAMEEQNLGVNFAESLMNLRRRMPSDDLDLFIMALLVHKKTGGNLAEVLDKTAGTIRDRFKIKREIRTKTAHGRFSGMILVLLPLFMIAVIMVLNPDYFMVLINERAGNYLLGAAVIMQLIGIWAIKKIVDIKI